MVDSKAAGMIGNGALLARSAGGALCPQQDIKKTSREERTRNIEVRERVRSRRRRRREVVDDGSSGNDVDLVVTKSQRSATRCSVSLPE